MGICQYLIARVIGSRMGVCCCMALAVAGRASVGEASVPLLVEICSKESAVRETQMLAHRLLGLFAGMAG